MRKGTIRDFSIESSVCAEYNSAGFKKKINIDHKPSYD